MLRATEMTMRQVAKETGLNEGWLTKIRAWKMKKSGPGIINLEILNDYLKAL